MPYENGYLIHYGIKGQKHGVRRFQNADGSLTDEGRRRYGIFERIPVLGVARRYAHRKNVQLKKELDKQDDDARKEGYELGRKWAEKTELGSYVRRKQEAEEKANQPGLIDRTVDSGVEKLLATKGLEGYTPIVSGAVKNAVRSGAKKLVTTPKGQKILEKTANVAGKGTAVAIDKAVLPAIDIAEKTVPKIPKAVVKGTSATARVIGKAAKVSYSWLKGGGADKIHHKSHEILKMTNKYGTLAITKLEDALRTGMKAAVGRNRRK